MLVDPENLEIKFSSQVTSSLNEDYKKYKSKSTPIPSPFFLSLKLLKKVKLHPRTINEIRIRELQKSKYTFEISTSVRWIQEMIAIGLAVRVEEVDRPDGVLPDRTPR